MHGPRLEENCNRNWRWAAKAAQSVCKFSNFMGQLKHGLGVICAEELSCTLSAHASWTFHTSSYLNGWLLQQKMCRLLHTRHRTAHCGSTALCDSSSAHHTDIPARTTYSAAVHFTSRPLYSPGRTLPEPNGEAAECAPKVSTCIGNFNWLY